jgi:hypothetical protein
VSADDRNGKVYTETVVYSPPEQYAADAPYQIAIVDLGNGERVTVRVVGKNAEQRASIGDRVTFVEDKNGVAYYRKA